MYARNGPPPRPLRGWTLVLELEPETGDREDLSHEIADRNRRCGAPDRLHQRHQCGLRRTCRRRPELFLQCAQGGFPGCALRRHQAAMWRQVPCELLRKQNGIGDEMRRLGLLGLLCLLMMSEARAANCSIPYFSFNITSEGPWPAFMTVKSGQSCGSRRWNFSTMVPKRLYLVTSPQHGRVTLSAPGGYRYSSAPGYVGKDTFTLRLCGTKDGGFEGCANLLFNVTVVN